MDVELMLGSEKSQAQRLRYRLSHTERDHSLTDNGTCRSDDTSTAAGGELTRQTNQQDKEA